MMKSRPSEMLRETLLISTSITNPTILSVLSEYIVLYFAKECAALIGNKEYKREDKRLGCGSFGETYVQISENVDNGTANYGLISYTIPDYANTVSAKFFYGNSMSNNSTTSTNVNIEARWGAYNQTGAVTGITFLNLTGNFTSGNYYIYGVK